MARVESILNEAKIPHEAVYFDTIGTNSTVRMRFADTDTQLKAKDTLQRALSPDAEDPAYIVALNLISNTPRWLVSLNALPMYLGLDLRGGVHFLLQVDMRAAIDKRLDTLTSDIRTLLREKNIRHAGINKTPASIDIRFRDAEMRTRAQDVLRSQVPELALRETGQGDDLALVATLTPAAQRAIQDSALRQNISTLHNRVNELGVAEPVIQQQGADRIVVQLPGVQDVARAKTLLGRTATLEIRLVDQDAMAAGTPGAVTVPQRDGQSIKQIPLKREIVATGSQLNGASATLDQNQRPAVSVRLDEAGGRSMRTASRENIGRLMAIVLYERGKGEAISVATIQGEFGNQFQITGNFTVQETADLALLIRSGSLAAPMEIIEERTIGPSLGAENIERGFKSTLYGFAVIAVFMILYYRVFGLISVAALTINLMLLVALLSLLQATLTLTRHRGDRAYARHGDRRQRADQRACARGVAQWPHAATGHLRGLRQGVGHDHGSNITTLIAGIALLTFGSGPVRGFAVVHVLGILTFYFFGGIRLACDGQSVLRHA